MSDRFLTALPVYNEQHYVDQVLDEVRRYSEHVLVVDDGSTDGTSQRLARRRDVRVVRHEQNRGYGAALATAFDVAIADGYEMVVTIDCDGQHEPQRIPRFVAACGGADIVSGSRYLKQYPGDSQPPAQRLWVNQRVTAELNRLLGLNLTDAFCGFKAYRTSGLRHLQLSETGYGMPLELWVQAAHAGLEVIELPVPLIYLDEKRSFGGVLDDAATRLEYYHLVLDRSLAMLPGEGRLAATSSRVTHSCGDHVG
ncbi:MAG: glycosyltransferase family 2 protein [Pirellulaceae bacterium]